MKEKKLLRNKQLNIRLTENEHCFVVDKATYCNISIAEYIRRLIVDGVVIKYDTVGIKEVCNEINKIGVNINQIAKHVNEKGGEYDQRIFEQLQTQYEELFNIVLDKIMGVE